MRVRSAPLTLLLSLLACAACGRSGDAPAAPAEPSTAEQYVQTLGRTYQGGFADRTRGDLQAIGAALAARLADTADYPQASDIDALAAQLEPRYIRSMPRADAWGHPFSYQGGGSSFTLSSAGADGTPGTADDLVVTEGGAR